MSRVLLGLVAATVLCAAVAPDPKDPQYQAKGDQHRSYRFPETGEKIPYRIYVPAKWNKNTKLPMLVVLHAGDSVDLPFERGNGVLAKLAEQRGYIVVAPMGYHPDPRPVYNSPYKMVSAPRPPSPPAATTTATANASAAKPLTPQESVRSEQDVLNVTDLVAKEYNADPSRVYLFANSFGAAGVWYVGQKYPERWAGLAVSSGPVTPEDVPYDRLKTVPVLVVHGEQDTTFSFDAAQRMAQLAKQHGVDATWMPVKDGTHLEAWTLVFPQILDFFDRHQKK